MSDIWFISDTHWYHENILNFVDDDNNLIRPGFNSINEMNELMIHNWNESIKPGDKVYHLGDVFLSNRESFKKMWPKLNGSKRLIVGNHDDIKFLSSGGFFKKVLMWRYFHGFNFVATHVPIHMDKLEKTKYDFNVHGHIHHNEAPTKNHINICVEKTNYKPVHIEEISKMTRMTRKVES